jgi:nucleoside-diphosphate-sugar epimerase
MSSPLVILVTGATGKQGGAVVRALLDSPANVPCPYSILALTRNPSSDAARKLASTPNVSLIQGDFNDCASIFSKIKTPLYGAFLVTYPSVGPFVKRDLEETQGKAFVDGALKHGVKYFVFSSIDRGGPQRSDAEETSIGPFASKARIEKYLIAKIAEQKVGEKTQYTILRTTTFFDNLTPNFIGRIFASMWRAHGSKPLVLISTHDIGIFVAKAFSSPSSYNNIALSIGSQALTYDQGSKIFKEAVGSEMQTAPAFVTGLLKFLISDLKKMHNWLTEYGSVVDFEDMRRRHPGMLDFEMWIKEESQFKKV